MDIAFGNLFAVLQLEEYYQKKISHGLLFRFASHVTRQLQYNTLKQATGKHLSSAALFLTDPIVLRYYTSHGTACETLFLERIIIATIATRKQRGKVAMKGTSGCTL